MDRDEALKLLTGGPKGVYEWNEWRSQKRHSTEQQLPLELSRADLSGVNLTRADLIRMDLIEADLHESNLTRALLHMADLTSADLRRANLTKASLSEANLTRAGLFAADLTDADLSGTNLTKAYLSKADLTGANLSGANLSGAYLDAVDGRFTDFTTTKYTVAERWWKRLGRFLTWQKVRSVGGLQILTKVSYAMLALVPILAGLWQGVNVWSGQTKLPSAWAVGFFAALFVVGGHFVYQLRCPELVAGQTPDKFADGLLAAFSADAPDRNDRLTRATNALKELAERDPTNRHSNLVLRHGRVVWIPSQLEFFETPAGAPGTSTGSGMPPTEPPAEAPAKFPVVSAGPGLMRVAIEEGARAEYELAALRDRGGATAAFLLYAVAGVLITWLVGSQAWSVARAAGWF